MQSAYMDATSIIALLCGALAGVGGCFIALLGGYTPILQSLFIFIGLDIITGLVESFFKHSTKTKSGKFSSNVMWKGLARKGLILVVIMVANAMDMVFGMDYLTSAVCLFYCIQECLSVLENLGKCGVPLPKKLVDILDVLDEQNEKCKRFN